VKYTDDELKCIKAILDHKNKEYVLRFLSFLNRSIINGSNIPYRDTSTTGVVYDS
jgi:hypothetical protein